MYPCEGDEVPISATPWPEPTLCPDSPFQLTCPAGETPSHSVGAGAAGFKAPNRPALVPVSQINSPITAAATIAPIAMPAFAPADSLELPEPDPFSVVHAIVFPLFMDEK